MQINQRAFELIQTLSERAELLRIQPFPGLANVWDFGVHAEGGLAAGILLARICMADLAHIRISPSDENDWSGATVTVQTDHPVMACMASQYAGWQISEGSFFAMGSGPMRAAAKKEKLFDEIPGQESPDVIVGVLETRATPTTEVISQIANACHVASEQVCLAVAPTASQAGTVQVVARAIETSLHKMHELGFDLSRVKSAMGSAPLPPVAKDDLAGIGRTNDAVLYGGRVTLWLRGDDASLASIVDQIPSNASNDFGRPFRDIFARYNHDFYQIDPHLFSPARITLINLDTGASFSAGRVIPEVLAKSFLG